MDDRYAHSSMVKSEVEAPRVLHAFADRGSNNTFPASRKVLFPAVSAHRLDRRGAACTVLNYHAETKLESDGPVNRGLRVRVPLGVPPFSH